MNINWREVLRPFWDRRIPKGMPEHTLRRMLEGLEVDFVVIGHTPQRDGRISNFYSMAFDVDVGVCPAYGENEPAAIVFDKEGAHAFYARTGPELLVPF